MKKRRKTVKTRRSRGQRLLIILGLLVVAGVLTRAFLGSASFRRTVASAAEAAIERATGEEAMLGDIDVHLWPPRATVEGLVIKHRESGDVIAALERAKVRVGLRGLKPRLLKLELEQPVVRLHIVDGKLREFAGARGGGGGEPMKELPWDELLVSGGSVHLAAGEGALVRLDGLGIAPGSVVDGEQTVTLTLDKLGLTAAGVTQEAEAVIIPNVTVTPSRIVAPTVALDLPLASLEGNLTAVIGGEISGLFQVDIDGVEVNHYLPEGVIHLGDWSLDVELQGQTSDPSAAIAVVGKPVMLDVRKLERPKRYHLGDVTALAIASREGLSVERLALDWAEGRVEAQGDLDWQLRLTDGVLRGEALSFAEVMKGVGQAYNPWVDFEGDLEILVDGTLKPLQLEGPFELAVVDFLVGAGALGAPATSLMLDIPRGAANGTLQMNSKAIQLNAARIRLGDTSGRLGARIGFSRTGPLDVALDLPYTDFSDITPLADLGLAGVGSLNGRISGPFKGLMIEGRAQAEDFHALDIPWADQMACTIRSDLAAKTLDFVDIEATRGETTYTGDLGLVFGPDLLLDLTAAVQAGRLSDLSGMFLEIPGLESAVSGELSLQGPVDALDGHGRFALADVNLFGERFANGDAVAWMKDGRFTLEDLSVWRTGGAETVRMRGSVGAGWALNAELIADNIRLEELDALAELTQPMRGELGMDARIGGTLFEPEPNGRLAAREVRVSGREAGDGDLYFDTVDGVMRFEGSLFDGALIHWGTQELFGEQRYAIGALMDRLPAHLFYPVAADGQPVTAELSGEALVSGAFGESFEPVQIDVGLDDVLLAWDDLRLSNPEPWVYHQRGRDLRWDPITLEGGDTSVTVSGEIRGGQIAIAGSGDVDLSLVRAFVDGVERSDGVASVALDIEGPVDTARARFDAEVEGAVLRTVWFTDPLEELDITLRGTPDAYHLETVEGLLGGGRASGGGTVTAENWIPQRFDLRATLTDARVRYLEEYLPPLVGDAELRFAGPTDALLLSGDVTIEEMVFVDRIDWEEEVLDFREELLVELEQDSPEEALFAFDVKIRADGTVALDNNVAQGTADADLHIVGDTARPGMIGSARLHSGGQMYLQEREFEIARAEMHYNDPYTFDPDLDFLLVTEVESQDQEYEIRYRISGPFSDWNTTPSSDPVLSQADINALLLFGVTQDQLAAQGAAGSLLLQEGADLFLAGLGLENAPLDLIGGGLDTFKPDRIDLVSGVSERGPVVNSEWRLVIEKDVPAPWDLTILGEVLLDNQLDQYWAVEKNLSRNLYTTAYWSSQQRERYLDIGGAYGVDLKVRWEID